MGAATATGQASSPDAALVRAADRRRSARLQEALSGRRLLLAAMALLAVTGQGPLWVALGTVVAAGLLAGPGRSVLSCIPAGFVLTFCLLLIPLLGCGLAGVSVLSSVATTRVLLLAATVPLVVLGERISPRRPVPAERRELVVCTPAVVVLGIGVWLSTGALASTVGGLLVGWDNGPHLLYAAAVHRDEALTYASNAYPRGVHALIAVLVAVGHDASAAPAVLEAFIRMQTLVIWTMYALLTAATALAALRLADLLALPCRTALTLATTAGLVMLTPGFLNFTVVFGFLTTISLALVLAVAALAVLAPGDPLRTAVVLAAVVAATANSYQLGLPLALLPIVLLGPRLAPALMASRATAAACGLLLATGVPPVAAAAQQIGLSAVALPGAAAALPWPVLVAGVAAALTLCFALGRGQGTRVPPRILIVAAVPLATVALALTVAFAAGASLSSYYPRKLLWHAAAASVPLAAAGAGLAYVLLRRRCRSVPVLRLSVTPLSWLVLALVAVFAIPGPYMAATGGWHLEAAPVEALMNPENEAAVCGLSSGYSRRAVVHYLHFYGAGSPWRGVGFAELPGCPRPPTTP